MMEQKSIPEIKYFITIAFEAYLARSSKASTTFFSESANKHAKTKGFLERLNDIKAYAYANSKDSLWLLNHIKTDLTRFYKMTFQPRDEQTRDEGHLHTLVTLLAGLIDNIDNFRDTFKQRHNLLQPPAIVAVAQPTSSVAQNQ